MPSKTPVAPLPGRLRSIGDRREAQGLVNGEPPGGRGPFVGVTPWSESR